MRRHRPVIIGEERSGWSRGVALHPCFFGPHTEAVEQLSPTLIALGSLAVAALTVIVTYLNAGRQARAAFELEHRKWLQEKQDGVYGRLLSTLASQEWWDKSISYDKRKKDTDEVATLVVLYASDDVYAQVDILRRQVKPPSEGQPPDPVVLGDAIPKLVRDIRAEHVGRKEMERAVKRADREFMGFLRSRDNGN
jgi:hypothetical protein